LTEDYVVDLAVRLCENGGLSAAAFTRQYQRLFDFTADIVAYFVNHLQFTHFSLRVASLKNKNDEALAM